ncbi:MAG: ABC transporter ATP-binding protein [Ruminococcaceae bacterium]|nr:ABC transporter ATP-binding protein [Oscillospiraceae bacterium]
MTLKEKREKRKAERITEKEKKAEEKRLERENRGTLKEQYANLWFAYKFLYKANKKLLFFRIPLIFLQSAKAVVPIFFVRAVLNELTIGRSIEKIILYASGMALATFGIKLFEYLFARWDMREREKMNFGVQRHLAKSVTDMSYSTIENPEMQNYVWMAQYNRFDQVLQLTTAVIGSFLTVFSISAVVFTMNPLILVVILVSATVKFLVDRKQRMLPHKYNDDRVPLSRVNEYYSGLMEEMETGKEVRINNLEDWVYDKADRSWKEDLYPLDKKFTQTTLALQGTNGLISVIQDIIVYLILAFEVIYSTMTVGDFSMYLTAAGTFSGLVTGISTNYSYLMIQTAWYLKEYRHCLDVAEKLKAEGNTHIDIPENVEIEFRDVSFKYPKTDRMILEHVNITIGKGETLSIVGVNGAGKTTFVKLLCRFYEPTSGEILVNGIPAKDIPLNEYYGLLGVVFQDFSLFSFTVRENIAMDTECDDERLRDAVRKCGLDGRMETLPHGADTYIWKMFDPDGIELSGGEGQKIAIARAVYRGAPIVIFDEPTSALDPIAEYDIYRNFHDLAENRTAIYISHRLSSTRFTDKTAVFSGGTIAEYGTHAELMEIENGIYRDMFSMQAKYYKE